MPTIDDLREALTDRERHAGDPDAVRHHLHTHLYDTGRGHRPAVRRWAAPLIAAAAVAGVALATVAVSQPGGGHRDRSASGPTDTAATSPITGLAAVPANALRWGFTVAGLPGYSVSYDDYRIDQQNASVTSATDKDFNAGVSVHTRGTFDPATGSVDGAAVRGQDVTINGRHGVFVAGPSTPTLFWSYAADSWASVSVSDAAGTPAATAQAKAQRIADAVRFGTSGPVTLPFRVTTNVPRPFKFVDVGADPDQPFLMYSTSTDPDDVAAIALTVVLRSPAAVAVLRRKGQGPGAAAGRTLSRSLPDGSELLVTVQPNHLTDISPAAQRSIFDSVRTSPTPSNRSTWLPVVP